MAATIGKSLEMSATDRQPGSDRAWTSPASFWVFSEAHLEILARFRDRTALTIGDQSLSVPYRDVLCQLAMTVCIPRFSASGQMTDTFTARLPHAYAT
jgi:hypothetical protein